jgi:hypothetical protein
LSFYFDKNNFNSTFNGRHASLTMFSIDFSFQNLVFWNLFEFSVAKIIKNPISRTFESKFYQIISIKSCSSRSFQQHQRHILIPQNFQLQFNLIFNEKIIQYSRTSTLQVQMPSKQADAPLLESFPK